MGTRMQLVRMSSDLDDILVFEMLIMKAPIPHGERFSLPFDLRSPGNARQDPQKDGLACVRQRFQLVSRSLYKEMPQCPDSTQ